MSSIILNGTIDVLSKALKNFASEDKTKLVRPSEVILIIGISDIDVEEPTEKNPIKRVEGEPYYRVIKKGEPYIRSRKIKVHPGVAMTDEVTFLQVLDAKLDFFQVEAQAKPYLMDAFKRLTDEVNGELMNDEGFKSYIEASLKPYIEAGQSNEVIEKEKNNLIDQNLYKIADLEIWIITPKKADKPGLNANEQDLPIQPVPFLYAKGERVRQIEFAKDIFQMVE